MVIMMWLPLETAETAAASQNWLIDFPSMFSPVL